MTIYLSPKERKIVTLIANGLKDREIAAEFKQNERTVREQLKMVYVKLSATNRPNAIHRAWQEGILGK